MGKPFYIDRITGNRIECEYGRKQVIFSTKSGKECSVWENKIGDKYELLIGIKDSPFGGILCGSQDREFSNEQIVKIVNGHKSERSLALSY